ncbi:MAG: helix-turn-helix transcriptional regulator [Clostridiales bacterium]|nr:helix-turn-helix transcriptional regulator [Clostridiales bacterium]
MVTNKLAETLRELRIHCGMTQGILAGELNISRQTYSNYESGSRLPDLETACRIAEYHHITLDQLVITGVHPTGADPFAALPPDDQDILRSYHDLSPEDQKNLTLYLKFLKQKK